MKVEERFAEGQILHGFLCKRIREIPVIHQRFYELEHVRTGARWVHLANDDAENVFGVIIKTIPEDSTGVPHILEHSVLCGSEKFPAKDPFFGMIRRSLQTFMNAFTWPDRTAFPFATQNKKDFYNLMDVYLDAVFFSRISRLHFLQEGWRIEFNKDGELEYRGVVYNEMKGALSQTMRILNDSLGNALFPTATYGYNSGGDPADIPKLTYEQLKKFYLRFYHPSNARFYSYGNMPLRGHLKFVAEKVMNRFEPLDSKTEVELESRWKKPKKATYYYPLGKGETGEKKHQVALGWVMAPTDDTYEILILELLEAILLGDAAAPLRKALIDSGLGSNLCDPNGLDADNRQAVFACGLKDVAAEDGPEIERLIISTLEKLVHDGIDRDLVESAFHQLELYCREIKGDGFPYGLLFAFKMAANWIHGGDPLDSLDYGKNLEKLRRELAREPVLENRIRKYFLNNPHRVLLTLSPKPGLAEERDKRTKKELAAIRAGLTPIEEERIRREAAELEALQNSSENFDCLPGLEIEDIPPKVKRTRGRKSGSLSDVVRYIQPTNGMLYFSAFWEIKNLPERLRPLLPLFCFTVSRVGTKNTDYAEWARRIAAHTGGISIDVSTHVKRGAADNCLSLLSLSGKCLARKQSEMFSLLKEALSAYSFADKERLKTLMVEYVSYIEDAIISSGHRYALRLATRGFSRVNALNEAWEGVHHFRTVKELVGNLSDEVLEKLSRDLTRIGGYLLNNDWQAAIIGEKSDLDRAMGFVRDLENCLPAPKPAIASSPAPFQPKKFYDGWSISVNGAYVASAFPVVDFYHPDAPVLAIIAMLLKAKFIHREIREKGGAYGGYASYNSREGIFAFSSYRDPNIVSTLDAYERAFAFIKNGSYDEGDVRNAILQVCAGLDAPLSPHGEADMAFLSRLIGVTDKARQQYKERLLKTDLARVREVAERYFTPENIRACSVAVISSEEKFSEENARLTADGKKPLKLHKI